MLMAAVAMLVTNSASAQSSNQGGMGKGSSAGSQAGSSYNGMPWLVGLGTLGVLATVVGITAAATSTDNSSYGH